MPPSRPLRIVICVLTMHERTGWVCYPLSQWLTDLPFTAGDIQFSVTYAHNFMPAASARNRFCRKMKDGEPAPDWILMIDNDMVPPRNLLDTVKDAPADAAVVVPQFQMGDESKPSVALCWGLDESVAPKATDGSQSFTIEPGKWYELTKCGTGAIFIKPEIFHELDLPYFCYPYNEEHGINGTEDIDFCQKIRAKGMKIYGNGSVRVGHYKTVNLDVLMTYVHLIKEQTKKEVESKYEGSKLVMDEAECPSDSPVAVARPA